MNLVVTAGGILLKGNKILLVKKKGKYVIPKGHLENSETLEQAALREVREETGYMAKVTGYYGALTRISTENSGEVVKKKIEVFKMDPIRTASTAPDEESEWVDISKAPDQMLYAEEQKFLRQHLRALFGSETFAVAGSNKIACLISGYRGKIRGYIKAWQGYENGNGAWQTRQNCKIRKSARNPECLAKSRSTHKNYIEARAGACRNY
jgi:ADP-ribose pyrophosphatase YjhB (NUDIX family)